MLDLLELVKFERRVEVLKCFIGFVMNFLWFYEFCINVIFKLTNNI